MEETYIQDSYDCMIQKEQKKFSNMQKLRNIST